MNKRKWIGRMPALLLSALLAVQIAAPCPAAAGEANTLLPALPLPAAENGQLMTLPIGEDPELGPQDTGYIFEEGQNAAAGYADPSITVRIGWGRTEETDYVYARIRIADASQLRTKLASAFRSENTVMGTTLAKRVQSVVAINGDFCAKQVKGTVIRQGETLRLNSNGEHDVLLIDAQGDLHILEKATDDNVLAWGEDAINVFTFGPALIVNGEPRYGYKNNSIGTHKAAQRMAICQTGPLEYLLITSEGPEDPGSTGLKLDQFVDLLASFGEIQQAYNLDGGSCSTLVFRKNDNNWAKINTPKNGKSRTLKDIIYFADAWIPDSDSAGEAGETDNGGD